MPLLLLVVCALSGLDSGRAQSDEMTWLNRPKNWTDRGGTIAIAVEGKTDFWRTTHYGYITDNGHFYYREREGDFTATVSVQGEYASLYDQAGLMIRIDEKNWIKTGVEFVNGAQNISTVVTREFSDWSVIPKQAGSRAVRLKLVRKNDYVEISYSLDGTSYQVVREAYFPPTVKCQIGVMGAAPEGKGFRAAFQDFKVTSDGHP
jgi:uncharacterized protein